MWVIVATFAVVPLEWCGTIRVVMVVVETVVVEVVVGGGGACAGPVTQSSIVDDSPAAERARERGRKRRAQAK
jgi:hypothetical protein